MMRSDEVQEIFSFFSSTAVYDLVEIFAVKTRIYFSRKLSLIMPMARIRKIVYNVYDA